MSDGFDPILQQAEQRRLREQVLWRLGIAAGLIAVVLGAIYLLDLPQQKPQLEPSITPRIAPQPSEIPPSPEPTLEASAASAVASVPEASVASAAPTTAPATATPTPSVAPSPASTPLPHKVPAREIEPISNVPTAPAAVQEMSEKPQRAPTRPPALAPTRPSAADVLLQPQTLLQGPSGFEPQQGSNGYTVQAGVFLHATNAQKLLRQLEKAGVPAYLETRVQIGPFKNKAEAEAAVAKLRALGIQPILRSN